MDWLGRNLYWTDSLAGTIEVAKLDTQERFVLFQYLDHPSVITLDPMRGYVYICFMDV